MQYDPVFTGRAEMGIQHCKYLQKCVTRSQVMSSAICAFTFRHLRFAFAPSQVCLSEASFGRIDNERQWTASVATRSAGRGQVNYLGTMCEIYEICRARIKKLASRLQENPK